MKRRYFDNAATTFPKPPGVSEAVRDYLENIGASAGRGSYREAVAGGKMLSACRTALRELFSCQPRDAVVFALNGTDALNISIKGLLRPGDHVVTSSMDHNSVLRPISAIRERCGVSWTVVEPDPATTILSVDAVVGAIRNDTRAVVLSHASNVTGAIQPIEPIAEACRRRGVLFVLDAAQSAGHIPIVFGHTPIDVLACSGHKGLLGPLGTGVLVLRAGIETQLQTYREGGTGSRSESATQPDTLPDKFESGSHNAVGLAGLLASVRWILDCGVATLRAHEIVLCERMITRLDEIAGLRWFGPRDPAARTGVFSVRIDGIDPAEASALMEEQFGILTRSGLLCAPFAHCTIGTADTGGTTRLSVGPFTTIEDVDAACDALTAVARSALPSGADSIPPSRPMAV